MREQQEHIPWWQRELNARLARRALRREALRRLAVRAVSTLALIALGLLLALALAQGTQDRLAEGPRHAHRGGAFAGVAPSPTPTREGTATAANGKPRASGATLTLDPPATGAASTKQGAKLRVTLTDRTGAPLPGITIRLTITGLVPYAGAATTNTNGVADFRYRGDGSPYTVMITATADGSQLAESTVHIGGAGRGVATTEVTGRFYPSDDRCTFDTPAGTPALFTDRFPTINFGGRPFTGYGATAGQHARVAAGGGHVIGIGELNHFNAVFTGSLVVRRAGDVSLTFLIDDAFNFGIGAGASRVGGTFSNPPRSGVTALERLPVVGAFNQGHLEATTWVTVHVPHPGSFPYEIDYGECRGGNAAIRISTDGQFLPTVGLPTRHPQRQAGAGGRTDQRVGRASGALPPLRSEREGVFGDGHTGER